MINANLSVPKNWEILVQNLVTKACTKCIVLLLYFEVVF